MGADKQFGSLMQLRNTSKPIKIGLLKYKQFHSACLFGALLTSFRDLPAVGR
jgi:hypothetical protein